MPLPPPRAGESVGFHIYPATSHEGTLGDPEKVIWSSIRHLSSREVAQEYAATRGVTTKRDRQSVADSLKLYVQQASEFYEAAQAAKPNTAPLIYYYSFLNLAKAVCELSYPYFHSRDECYYHGLSWRPNSQRVVDPAKEEVKIVGRGVWHVVWESMMRLPCPHTNPAVKIRIKELFSFEPDISYEFSQAFGEPARFVGLENPDILLDKAAREAWIRFSVDRFWLRHFRLSARELTTHLTTTRTGYAEVKENNRELRTFQSAIAKQLTHGEDILTALRDDIVGINAFTHLVDGSKLGYLLTLQKAIPFHVPQLLVSYTILFWLGSLVRYDPHSVSSLMDSKYWILIDGFMSQSRLWLLELFEWALYEAETTLLFVR